MDDWLSRPTFGDEGEMYAKFVLTFARRPAWFRQGARRWMEEHTLFCTYEGRRYRVTGASRLGDVWLKHIDHETGQSYDLRADVAKCGRWGKER